MSRGPAEELRGEVTWATLSNAAHICTEVAKATMNRVLIIMAFGIMFAPADFWQLALVFVFGGVQVAIEETLEDSFCAELVESAQHGMAFGVLATVNGAGDFMSSVIVGLLWSAFGPTFGFGYSALLFTSGTGTRVTCLDPAWVPSSREFGIVLSNLGFL